VPAPVPQGAVRSTSPAFGGFVLISRIRNELNMSASLVSWAAIVLEGVILLRGLRNHLIHRYFLFYVYVSFVLLVDIVRLCCYRFAPHFYSSVYWSAELLVIGASYIVVIEIFKQVLKHNPGTARLAENLLLIVFACTLVYAGSDLLGDQSLSLPHAIAELARDLRYIEAALLAVMLLLFVRYRISIGKNLRGLIVGYAFWVGINVMILSMWFLPGHQASVPLRRALPPAYLITLLIWCSALWATRPEPVSPAENEVERDYQILAARTRSMLARVSNGLVKAMRP